MEFGHASMDDQTWVCEAFTEKSKILPCFIRLGAFLRTCRLAAAKLRRSASLCLNMRTHTILHDQTLTKMRLYGNRLRKILRSVRFSPEVSHDKLLHLKNKKFDTVATKMKTCVLNSVSDKSACVYILSFRSSEFRSVLLNFIKIVPRE